MSLFIFFLRNITFLIQLLNNYSFVLIEELIVLAPFPTHNSYNTHPNDQTSTDFVNGIYNYISGAINSGVPQNPVDLKYLSINMV